MLSAGGLLCGLSVVSFDDGGGCLSCAGSDRSSDSSEGGIVVFDLASGETLWSHDPGYLRDVELELHPAGLVVREMSYGPEESASPLFVDAATGAVRAPFVVDSERCVAREPRAALASVTLGGSSADAPRLANGWRLARDPLDDAIRFRGGWIWPAHLRFVADSGAVVWTLRLGSPPRAMTFHGDLVLVAGELAGALGTTSVAAFRAGASRPLWSVELSGLPGWDLWNGSLWPSAERLYVVGRWFVAALAIADGDVLWSRALGDEVQSGESGYDHGSFPAAVAESGASVVVRVDGAFVVLDRATGATRWHLAGDAPESFLVDGDRLIAHADRDARVVRPALAVR